MPDILGLSHLIFSSSSRILQNGSPLKNFFLDPVFQSFDHFEPKKDLLRQKEPGKTNLALYVSNDGSLPAFEIVPSKCASYRPLTSYGIIFPESKSDLFDGLIKFCPTAKFAEKLLLKKICMAEEVPSLVAFSPELDRLNCTMGAWINASDLECLSAFLTEMAGAKLLEKTESHALFTVKVMNKKFSSFFIAAFKTEKCDANYYNDDIGLAAFGWFAKRIPEIPASLAYYYSISPEFSINIKEKMFKAAFFYDNRSQSHEIMVMAKP